VNLVYPKDYSSASIQQLLDAADSDVLFLGGPRVIKKKRPRMFDRMAQVIRETAGGWVYADAVGQPRIDYQSGSVRDNFDFGPVVGVSVQAARQSGIDDAWKWGGLYDLRLRISEKHAIVRIPEPLYSASMADARPTGQKQFDYVDPRNRDYQIEMERIATAHLKRIGAWLQPHFAGSGRSGNISSKSQRRHTGSESRADNSRRRSKRPRPERRFRIQCDRRR